MKITGRTAEIETMKSLLMDGKGHLLALTGRRRVGKTFLIREVYKNEIVFEMTGLMGADLKDQLINYTIQMNRFFRTNEPFQRPESWLMAFSGLTQALQKHSSKTKQVVVFDELPWISSKRSGFTEAMAHWWNNWASQQNIVVVVCGSAASWMLKHVVNAKGGLHNRITRLITLMPFTLSETKEFLESKNIKLSNYQIAQIYMAMGGIPLYLDQIRRGKSAAQNIQDICFSKDGLLRTEFNNLYHSLFDNAGKHIKVIKALASKAKGLDRQEILAKTKMSDGGWFSDLLDELETSGFISAFQAMEKKKKGMLYRLTDEFSLFYLSFMEGIRLSEENNWISTSSNQEYKIWCGYSFENLCIKHVDEIKDALGISGVESKENSFTHRKDKAYDKGFQIDLLIDRRDDIINICEMKFYSDCFTIDSSYALRLRTKREGLKAVSGTKKMVHITFVSTYGVCENQHKIDLVDNDLTIDIFFRKSPGNFNQ